MEKILDFLRRNTECDLEGVTEDTQLIADLGIDSLEVLELVNAAEEEYDITIPDEQLNNIKTVGDLMAIIE